MAYIAMAATASYDRAFEAKDASSPLMGMAYIVMACIVMAYIVWPT